MSQHLQNKQYQQARALHQTVANQPLGDAVDALLVSQELMELNVDMDILTATILSDARILQTHKLEDFEHQFDAQVLGLLSDIIKLTTFDRINYQKSNTLQQRERVRLMLLSMIEDARVLFIKLAYRLVRLQHLSEEPEDIQYEIARETIDIYTPLANRFGLAQFKWKLEDLAFRYIHTDIYKSLAKRLASKKSARDAYIEQFLKQLQPILGKLNINYRTSGRSKHIYSIWNKMQTKKLDFDSLYDLTAVRIYVDNAQDCYAALGAIHTSFKPIPSEFDDYIANPKPNGYQSIHTVIVGPQDKTVEIQIRSQEMHRDAEFGIASHWQYKEGSTSDTAAQGLLSEKWQQSIHQLHDLLENPGTDSFMLDISKEINATRLFVLTTDSEIIELIKGATPLDFAYHIHTDLGHSCRATYVNDQMQPLNYELQNGDRIKIVTVKDGQPRRAWLNNSAGFVKTTRASNAIRYWFNRNDRKENHKAGKASVDKLMRRFNFGRNYLSLLLDTLNYQDRDRLYEDIGKGTLSEELISRSIQQILIKGKSKNARTEPVSINQHKQVGGTGNLPYIMSICCEPKPDDDISGLLTYDHTIEVHRNHCVKITDHDPRKSNLIPLHWTQNKQSYAKWPIIVKSYNALGVVRAVSDVIYKHDANIFELNGITLPSTNHCVLNVVVEVATNKDLSRMLNDVENIKHVFSVEVDRKKLPSEAPRKSIFSLRRWMRLKQLKASRSQSHR